MKIAISGVMCSGKTTISNYLIEKYNYKKFSFADDIKKYAVEIFDMKNKDRKLLTNALLYAFISVWDAMAGL